MIEIKANYWPRTPNLREIKIYIHKKFELGYFADYCEVVEMIAQLETIKQEMISNDDQ